MEFTRENKGLSNNHKTISLNITFKIIHNFQDNAFLKNANCHFSSIESTVLRANCSTISTQKIMSTSVIMSTPHVDKLLFIFLIFALKFCASKAI